MSRTSAAFLSFNSSGTIGDALTAAHWKGISYIRKYARPSNPNTQPQIDNRALMTNLVLRWRSNITLMNGKPVWNRLATYLKASMSGYNVFCQQSMSALLQTPTACVALNCEAVGDHKALFLMMALSDGGVPLEAGDFDILTGTNISALSITQAAPISPVGMILTPNALGETGDQIFIALQYNRVWRSGVYALTLL